MVQKDLISNSTANLNEMCVNFPYLIKFTCYIGLEILPD